MATYWNIQNSAVPREGLTAFEASQAMKEAEESPGKHLKNCPEQVGAYARANGIPQEAFRHINASTCPACGSYVGGRWEYDR